MSNETIAGWLAKEIKDAENVYGMHRSYRQGDSVEGQIALARLQALEGMRDKLYELWGKQL